MVEREVKFAPRYIKRKRSNAVGKNLSKTLTEPITNSDDSYRRLLFFGKKEKSKVFPITIYIDSQKRLVRIIDEAEGMTEKDLIEKFEVYGSDKSGASSGQGVRGIFGQGISDVLFYHSQGVIKSVKNGEAAICKFYEKRNKPFIKTEKVKGSILKISRDWGINSSHGTLVEFVLDKNTQIGTYEKLINRLSVFYMLRLIYADNNRKVKLIYISPKGQRKESVIKYTFPKGNLVAKKKFTMQFEKYKPVKIDVELYRAEESLERIGDERESGLLVYDNKNTVYDLTFFGLDHLLGTDKFFGFMKLTGSKEIILDKINDKKHPEEILTDTRDGFNKQHDFYKDLETIMKDWLYPIFSEERRRKAEEGLSEVTKENHRKAFNELNKLYSDLTGEYSSGTIRVPKTIRPAGGLEFSRKSISITAKKKYGIQLLIDTQVIKPGSIIELKSSKKKIGFSPQKITVKEPGDKKNDVLTKTITIMGNRARTADTLEARFKNYHSSVVVSVVSEEIFYPEDALAFSPDYFRAIVQRESSLKLYVDVRHIKTGSKIKLTSSNKSIKFKKEELIVKKTLRNTRIITRLPVLFVGNKSNESAVIEASYRDHTAQARVDIKDRIPTQPRSLGGKFKDWDFDEMVHVPFQASYDSNPESPTCGFILINPNHPINKKYFGNNPRKKDIEDSYIAQHYLAELILSECLNVTIPEALQKGGLPRRYGDYDVLTYIAQKKFEYGPSIYKYFVRKQSLRESKREKQLEVIKKKGVIADTELVDGMGDREKKMVEMRFGLNDQRPHTLEEIARDSNITRERVRQIINNALAKKYGDYDYKKTVAGKPDYIKKHEEEITTNVEKIIGAVSNFYGVESSDVKGRSRLAHLVKARQIAMYLARSLMGLSFPSIGRVFDRDHTTALYSFEKVMDLIEQDDSLKNQVDLIKDFISGKKTI